MEVGGLEEEAAESLVPGDGLDDALRRLELAVEHVNEGDWAPSGAPSAASRLTVCTSCLREGADRQRRALGEFAEPSQNPAAFGKQADGHARARRVVDALDDIVEVHPHAEFEAQTIVDAPAILHEQRELGAADLGLVNRGEYVVRSASEPSSRTTLTSWL